MDAKKCSQTKWDQLSEQCRGSEIICFGSGPDFGYDYYSNYLFIVSSFLHLSYIIHTFAFIFYMKIQNKLRNLSTY
jgi:hypothetical protein